jgi:hypothetical protein
MRTGTAKKPEAAYRAVRAGKRFTAGVNGPMRPMI